MPRPLLKWVGGKQSMLKHLKPLLPERWNVWHEPFVGAGGMLFGCAPEKARVNDSNWMLVNFHRQVKERPEELREEAFRLGGWEGCTEEMFIERRRQFNRMISEREESSSSAAMMYWVVRHSFNGLYRVNSKGLFNAPWNRNMARGMLKPLEDFLACSAVLKNAVISCGDFEAFLEPVEEGDFVFLDPPYIPDLMGGSFVSYAKEGFQREDHERTARLARELADKGAFVMATNNDTPWTRELYEGFSFFEYGTAAGIKSGRERKELAMTSYVPKGLDTLDKFC